MDMQSIYLRQNVNYLAQNEWNGDVLFTDENKQVFLLKRKDLTEKLPGNREEIQTLKEVVDQIERTVKERPEILSNSSFTSNLKIIRSKYKIYQQEVAKVERAKEAWTKKIQAHQIFDQKLQDIEQALLSAFQRGKIFLNTNNISERFENERKIIESVDDLKIFANNCKNLIVKNKALQFLENFENEWKSFDQQFDSTQHVIYDSNTTKMILEFYLKTLSLLSNTENSLFYRNKENIELQETLKKLEEECLSQGDDLHKIFQSLENYKELFSTSLVDLKKFEKILLNKIRTENQIGNIYVVHRLKRLNENIACAIEIQKAKEDEFLSKLQLFFLSKENDDYPLLLELLTKLHPDYSSLVNVKIDDLRKLSQSIRNHLSSSSPIVSILLNRIRKAIVFNSKTQPFYVDSNRLMKSHPNISSPLTYIDPNYRNWYLHQAQLLSSSLDQAADEETKKQLGLLVLHGYSKAASIDPSSSADLGIQITPLFPDDARYHRSESNTILKYVQDAFARDMGLDEEQFFIVDSPFIHEVISREFPQDPKLDLNITNEIKFSDLVDGLLHEASLGNFPENPLTINISSLVKNPEDLKKVTEKLEKILFEKCLASLSLYTGTNKELIDRLLAKLHLFAYIKHKGQYILAIPAFSFENHAAFMNPDTKKTFDSLVNSHSKFWKQINTIMAHAGFLLGPDKAKEAWLSIEDIATILKNNRIFQVSLATAGTKTPEVVKSLEEFLNAPMIKDFQELSEIKEAPAYLQILPAATTQLLKGLLLLDRKLGGIHNIFRKKGIEDSLQVSYFLIFNAIREAILRKDDLIAFNNQIDLIHQQIQNILEITQPYGKDDFSKHMVNKLKKEGLVPPELEDPKIHVKPSAMHCLASVIGSIEAQKNSQFLNIAVLKDSYYESCDLLKNAKTHKISQLDGDLYNKNNREAMGKIVHGPIDLFLCEFHHNISTSRQSYNVENIKEQVKDLFNEGLAAKQLTLLVDSTINLEVSDDFRNLLADKQIQDLVRSGRLNIVFLRSAQKFDMLGLDNYYGGITTTINDKESFINFNQRMDHPADQLGGLSYQGLTHLEVFSGSFIDQYRQAIMNNTKKLYSKLPKEAIYHPNTINPMQISSIDDDKLVFLDIKFPNCPLVGEYFSKQFERYCVLNKLPLTHRPSFGFVNSNFTTINAEDGTKKYRLNPGLENDQMISKYAGFFTKFQRALQKVTKQAMEEVEKEKEKLPASLEVAKVRLDAARKKLFDAKLEEKTQAKAELDLAEVLFKNTEKEIESIKKNPWPLIDELISKKIRSFKFQ